MRCFFAPLFWSVALPITLVVIDMLACLAFILCKNYAKALYWFSAGLITFSTILMK